MIASPRTGDDAVMGTCVRGSSFHDCVLRAFVPGDNTMMKHGLKGLAIGSTVFAILLLSGCNESSPTATSATATCGNTALESGEDCDGPNLAGKSCKDFGKSGGTLACTANCTFDTSACQ
jgi:hypothetical protein